MGLENTAATRQLWSIDDTVTVSDADQYQRRRESGFKDPYLERHLEDCISQKQRLRHVEDPVKAREKKLARIKDHNRKVAAGTRGLGLSETELQLKLRQLKPSPKKRKEEEDDSPSAAAASFGKKSGGGKGSSGDAVLENELQKSFRQFQQKKQQKEQQKKRQLSFHFYFL